MHDASIVSLDVLFLPLHGSDSSDGGDDDDDDDDGNDQAR